MYGVERLAESIRRYFHKETGPIVLLVSLLTCGAAASGSLDIAGVPGSCAQVENSEVVPGGDTLFIQMREKYEADPGFQAWAAKLAAAETLAEQMCWQLQKATRAQLFIRVDKVLEESAVDQATVVSLAVPAKQYYTTSSQTFLTPVNIAGVSQQGQAFLAQYYSLKLKQWVNGIAETGRPLTIAEPLFKGMYDYVLVLPLLHATEVHSVNVLMLPRWLRAPEQLDEFSDSCLLRFEMPSKAMLLAKRAAQGRAQSFSEIEFYRNASRKCVPQSPHVAVECLKRALELIPDDVDGSADLEFEIVQAWLDSGNYQMAAGEARRIFEAYPAHERFGQAVWLYYYALSKGNDTQQILVDIDQILDLKQCSPYRSKLMYLKWWALRHQRHQGARIAALEHEILEQYGDDPIVAQILLSQATDRLASQLYDQASSMLRQLVERFPSTRAAAKAQRMLEKLDTVQKGM